MNNHVVSTGDIYVGIKEFLTNDLPANASNYDIALLFSGYVVPFTIDNKFNKGQE